MKRSRDSNFDSALRTSHSALAYVGLGSNLGNSRRMVRDAMDGLQALSDRPILRSALWQTSPVDCPPGSPDFINAAVGLVVRPGETPESLLEKLQALEKAFGRQSRQKINEPRSLDLDLIAFGSERRVSPRLTLPHPRAHQRRFVLQPLCEIAPDFVLPGQTGSVAALLAELRSDESAQRVG